MTTLVYKDHFIVAESIRDNASGTYKPIVLIAWYASDGKRSTKFLTLANDRCASFDDANSIALENAKAWVDALELPRRPVAMRLLPSSTTLRNVCKWPPTWVRLGRMDGNGLKIFRGEIGVLKDVRRHPDRPVRIYLTVDHGGADYVACVPFKNPGLCDMAFEHLRRCYGMIISDVGSSELPLIENCVLEG